MMTDGVLGLSPNFINGEVSNGELFIKKLNASGKISKAMFSLYFARTTTTSKMHFGGWSDTYVNAKYTASEKVNKTASELVNWMNLTSPNYWQVRLTKVNVYNYTSNNGTNYTIWPTYSEAVIDSGSTYSYLPSADFQSLYSAIRSHNTSCTKNGTSGVITCGCNGLNDTRFLNISL
jgi:hypothetical protein